MKATATLTSLAIVLSVNVAALPVNVRFSFTSKYTSTNLELTARASRVHSEHHQNVVSITPPHLVNYLRNIHPTSPTYLLEQVIRSPTSFHSFPYIHNCHSYIPHPY